jgi:predicted dehydrogenase
MSTTPPPLRIGIVGYGVMGKAHNYGYRVAPLVRRLAVTPVVTVMSGRDAGAVAAAARAYGFRDGAAVQAVCDAMETSAASGRWVSVSEVLASAL